MNTVCEQKSYQKQLATVLVGDVVEYIEGMDESIEYCIQNPLYRRYGTHDKKGI